MSASTPEKKLSLPQLLDGVKAAVPEKYREECWYLVAAASLIELQPTLLGELYVHLTKSGTGSELPDPEKARLSYRLREVLMKECTIVGIVKVIVALSYLAKVEGQEGEGIEGLSEKWCVLLGAGSGKLVGFVSIALHCLAYCAVCLLCGSLFVCFQCIAWLAWYFYFLSFASFICSPRGTFHTSVSLTPNRRDADLHTTRPRGSQYMKTLYQQNLDPIFSTWASHRADFEFLEESVVYGLYLSDHTVLSAVESEIVTVVSIMCQGMRDPTYWHLRGLRRLGVAEEDVEGIQRAVEAVAGWCEVDTRGWVRVREVKEVNEG
jgi:hypothetical protein